MARDDDDDDLVGGRRKTGKRGKPGHNSGDVGGIAGDHLMSFVERIERLEEEKRGLQEDVKEVYAEAKGTGFDTKTIRELIRLRRRDKADRQERRTMLELYAEAIGMEL